MRAKGVALSQFRHRLLLIAPQSTRMNFLNTLTAVKRHPDLQFKATPSFTDTVAMVGAGRTDR
jgi:hypothetical protein